MDELLNVVRWARRRRRFPQRDHSYSSFVSYAPSHSSAAKTEDALTRTIQRSENSFILLSDLVDEGPKANYDCTAVDVRMSRPSSSHADPPRHPRGTRVPHSRERNSKRGSIETNRTGPCPPGFTVHFPQPGPRCTTDHGPLALLFEYAAVCS